MLLWINCWVMDGDLERVRVRNWRSREMWEGDWVWVKRDVREVYSWVIGEDVDWVGVYSPHYSICYKF